MVVGVIGHSHPPLLAADIDEKFPLGVYAAVFRSRECEPEHGGKEEARRSGETGPSTFGVAERSEGRAPPQREQSAAQGRVPLRHHRRFRLWLFGNWIGQKAVRSTPKQRPRRGRGQIPPLRSFDCGRKPPPSACHINSGRAKGFPQGSRNGMTGVGHRHHSSSPILLGFGVHRWCHRIFALSPMS
jgi:hypothetical protein